MAAKANVIGCLITIIGITSVLVNGAFTPNSCKSNQWTCDDGQCIDQKLVCDGAIDCTNGATDETFPLCRNKPCAGFKCLYGGCVPSNATCNGVRDCVDGSDELLLKCRNETTYQECVDLISYSDPDNKKKWDECKLKWRTCKDGEVLPHYQKCDGEVDCEDGSDERLETCASDQRDCDSPSFGSKFRCKYGGCIDQWKVCDGNIDCVDATEELNSICDPIDTNTTWECNDGTSIKLTLKCNGAVDCPDGSDETFLSCRNNECPFGFRCVYGGCIKNTGICNGIKDCADNSDELLTRCRNKETYVECYNKIRYAHLNITDRLEKSKICNELDKKCDNGQTLANIKHMCDGRVHCEDGSDETLENCSTDRHNCLPNGGFRCKYGGCIAKDRACNKIQDCADGSDEFDDLCNVGKCVLPEYPEHGNYTVVDEPRAEPGMALKSILMLYTCEKGYKPNRNSSYVICVKGVWAEDPLECIAQCDLTQHPSINYWCLKKGSLFLADAEECGDQVPDGTTVIPECREPSYYYPEGVLSYMFCLNGTWDRQVPICAPRCGLVTPEGDKLVINGTSAERGKLPWHAGIYRKTTKPYEQICGGSLISDTIVLTAAHCFWSDLEKLLPAENYAVALGKLYRPWNDPMDKDAQKSDVEEIVVPSYFHGSKASFQDDIALLILTTRITYRTHVRPVCLDFSLHFERKQLRVGQYGTVAGWGLTAEDGKASPVLKVTRLPYIDINRCYKESPPAFYMYITSDKFCAGNYNHATLCQGDSGGGLVFSTRERNQERYYLRGVVSTKAQNDHRCNAYAHTTFTQVSKHKEFIQEHWD